MTTAELPEGPTSPGAEEGTPTVGRLVAFSDGVFAIAITLLVLQLKVPPIADATSAGDLARALGAMSGQFGTYVITFGIIGLYWFAHHRMFDHIVRHDQGLGWLNMASLLTVAALPFTADLLAQYPNNATATVFYATNLALTSLSFLLIGLYARARGYYSARTPHEVLVIGTLRSALITGVFVASIGIAFLSTSWAQYTWFALVPVSIGVDRWYRATVTRRRGHPGGPGPSGPDGAAHR
ncbi:MAG TPA: TMEM175 family protein [Acidimicrobiales bacterium]|nr:TMEM175 family protein [Acidimicrobiales bacterium]